MEAPGFLGVSSLSETHFMKKKIVSFYRGRWCLAKESEISSSEAHLPLSAI